jgi:hypothetical protein
MFPGDRSYGYTGEIFFGLVGRRFQRWAQILIPEVLAARGRGCARRQGWQATFCRAEEFLAFFSGIAARQGESRFSGKTARNR